MSKMVFFKVVLQPHNFLVDKKKKLYLLSNVIASVEVRFAFRLFLIVRNEGGEVHIGILLSASSLRC